MASWKVTINKLSFRTVLKKFSDNTSIHCLFYLARPRCRIAWTLLTIAVAFYCAYKCKLNVDSYLRFEVSTKVTEVESYDYTFLGITFTSLTSLKRSGFGNILFLPYGIANLYAGTSIEGHQLLRQTKIATTCDNNNNITDEERGEYTRKFVNGANTGALWNMYYQEFFTSFESAVKKSFWHGREFNSTTGFINHVTDVGFSFTFNPGMEFVKIVNKNNMGGGIDSATYNESRFNNFENKLGLRLILNVNQTEYCGHGIIKRGAGFLFQVHDNNRNPSFAMNPSTYISPGYDYNVVMKPIFYRRNTENLGNCSKFVYLYGTPEAKVYVQEHCFVQCINEQIMKTCHCRLPMLSGFNSTLIHNRMRKLNITKGDFATCVDDAIFCMKTVITEQIVLQNPYSGLCTYCKQPCFETKYNLHVTSSLLSCRNWQPEKFQVETFEEFRKNYIFISFTMDTNSGIVIEENQAFSLQDMFIYIGGNICLFLGMSFISPFELLHLCADLVIVCFKKRLNREKETRAIQRKKRLFVKIERKRIEKLGVFMRLRVKIDEMVRKFCYWLLKAKKTLRKGASCKRVHNRVNPVIYCEEI